MNAFPFPAAAAKWRMQGTRGEDGVGSGKVQGSCHIYHYAAFLIAQERSQRSGAPCLVSHAFCPLPACA